MRFVEKRKMEKDLQILLSTRNKFEKGDDKDTSEPFTFTLYFTNGEPDSTHNLCDIRIDYLKTRNCKVIYVENFEILNYIK